RSPPALVIESPKASTPRRHSVGTDGDGINGLGAATNGPRPASLSLATPDPAGVAPVLRGARAKTPLNRLEADLLTMAVDWGEVTAIAASILAIGLLGGIAAAIFTAQQVREARKSREAHMAAEF